MFFPKKFLQSSAKGRRPHKLSILKNGIGKRNQVSYAVKGFRLFEKVACKGEEGFILAVDFPEAFTFESQSIPAFQPASAVKRCICRKKTKLSDRNTKGGGASSPARRQTSPRLNLMIQDYFSLDKKGDNYLLLRIINKVDFEEEVVWARDFSICNEESLEEPIRYLADYLINGFDSLKNWKGDMEGFHSSIKHFGFENLLRMSCPKKC